MENIFDHIIGLYSGITEREIKGKDNLLGQGLKSILERTTLPIDASIPPAQGIIIDDNKNRWLRGVTSAGSVRLGCPPFQIWKKRNFVQKLIKIFLFFDPKI